MQLKQLEKEYPDRQDILDRMPTKSLSPERNSMGKYAGKTAARDISPERQRFLQINQTANA